MKEGMFNKESWEQACSSQGWKVEHRGTDCATAMSHLGSSSCRMVRWHPKGPAGLGTPEGDGAPQQGCGWAPLALPPSERSALLGINPLAVTMVTFSLMLLAQQGGTGAWSCIPADTVLDSFYIFICLSWTKSFLLPLPVGLWLWEPQSIFCFPLCSQHCKCSLLRSSFSHNIQKYMWVLFFGVFFPLFF